MKWNSYNALGDLIEVKNALGHAYRYGNHDAMGRPGRLISKNGAIVDYVYDGRGRTVLVRSYPNGTPVDTNYIYGASGLLEAMQSSDGKTILYHYDAARRLIQEDLAAPGGGYEVRRTFYNGMSQPVRIETGRE